MSVPIGWPGEFEADTLDGSEALPVLRNNVQTIVTTTADIGDAPSPLGPIDAGTTSGSGTAYTATAGQDVVTGRVFAIRPHTTNTGTATLSINGGTARSWRTESGTVLTAGLLRSGVEYFIRYDGTVFRTLGLRLGNRFQSRVNFEGSTATIDFYNTVDGTLVGRALCDSDGRWLFQSNGSTALEIQADLDVRAFGRLLNAYSQEVYSPSNPPEFDFDDVAEVAESVMGPAHETAVEGLVSTDTAPVPHTGADLNRQGWANVAGAWRDMEPLPVHTSARTVVASSQTVNFYTGGSNFVGRTSNVVQVTGPAVVDCIKQSTQQSLQIAAIIGTLSDVAGPTIPVASRTWVGAGQSWMARAIWNGLSGVRDTYVALNDAGGSHGLYTRVIDGAVGASALLYGAATVSTNYWWHHLNDLPGPNAEALRDTILAWIAANPTQPSPEAVLWCFGLNDLSVFASSGDNTPAAWTQAFLDMQAWLDTELGVTLNHFISPLPARKLGVFDENKWYAMRRAQLDCVANGTNVYRLADSYDLSRMWNDEHHNFAMQKRWGARWPWFVENALNAGTNYEGPEITGFTEVDSSTYWVRINRGVGASLVRPGVPAGFGLIPAGSHFFETRVDVARYSWTTDAGDDILVITPRTAATGLRLCYPYGSSYEMMQPARIIRDAGTLLPLKTYHPTV